MSRWVNPCNGETRIDDLVDLRKALEVLPHQGQSGVRRQVVGQALDLKVGHGDGGGGKAVIISNARRLHPPGEQKNTGNSCQARVLAVRVTDSGDSQKNIRRKIIDIISFRTVR